MTTRELAEQIFIHSEINPREALNISIRANAIFDSEFPHPATEQTHPPAPTQEEEIIVFGWRRLHEWEETQKGDRYTTTKVQLKNNLRKYVGDLRLPTGQHIERKEGM